MSVQKKCLTASAITHGLLVLLFFVGSAFVPSKRKPLSPEFEIFELPKDFDLVAEDNVFSGGNPNAKKGTGLPAPDPKPIIPPQPKPEPQKQEVPDVKPPEPKPEPAKQPDPVKTPEPQKQEKIEPPAEKPKPVIDPDAFKLLDKIKKEAETPKKTIDIKQITKSSTKRTITTSQETKPSKSNPEGETKVALNNAALDAIKNLGNKLQSGGSPNGREDSDIDDILGPGGARVASYSIYLAGIYRSAWIPPAKSSARSPIQVRVTISRDGVVLAKTVVTKSGNRDFDQAAERTINRVQRFDKAPPTKEASVTYTIEFVPPE